MGAQVLKFSLVVSAFIYVGTFLYLVLSSYDAGEMKIAFYYEMAERGVLDDNGFNRPYTFRDRDGELVTLDAVDFYRDATYRSIRDGFFQRIFTASRFSVLPAAVSGVLALLVFLKTGNRIQGNDFIRGAKLVSARQLKAWSLGRWKKYQGKHRGRKTVKPLSIAGIPFPPNAVEAQTCLYGTVGVGKTNAMSEMLDTIKQNGGRAVIYDRMGTFVSRFYDEDSDFILNPFDNRSVAWNPFDDVLDAASFTQMAEVMIPEHRGASSDPFWSQSARIVFDYAARELYKNGPRTVQALIDYVIRMDAAELARLISATPGAHFFNENIEKTAQSIRANLIAELRFLEFLRDDAEALSIRKWMQSEEPSFLFLTGDAEHAAATRNIISAVLEIAANALMSQGPASEPRCYFLMDELPSLNRLPFLVSSLAEIRQFGGAFVLGYQVYSQLEDIYGREAAQTISGTTNNRIVFNTPDFRTAKICSETLGNMDMWESNSNISVGAHEARDGVGFTSQRVERSIVSPAEIQNLPQFECYVKFAYDSPTAGVAMKIFEVEETQARFQPYMGEAFGAKEFPARKTKPENTEADNIVEEFHAWCGWKFDCSGLDLSDSDAPHPKFAAYFEHFEEARQSGAEPEVIKPIVLVNRGLVQNNWAPVETPADGDTTPAQTANGTKAPTPAARHLPKPARGLAPDISCKKEAGDTALVLNDPVAPARSRSKVQKPARVNGQSPVPRQASLPFPDDWSPTSKWTR